MKKYFLLSCLLLCAGAVFAQGIEFSHGTWKEVLAKAKQEDKLVFIDVYTSWCGPCKKMAAEVFPLKEVGDVFNPAFVNYKLDAEKGEGIEIAKKFEVRSFPTYLFINGDGVLVYRTGGYNEAKIFLKEADIAIKEKRDSKPLEQWDQDYLAGKRDKDFLMGYLKKRAAVKAPNGIIIEDIFPLLRPDELSDRAFLKMVFDYDPSMTFVPNGQFYNYVVEHHNEIDKSLEKDTGYSLNVLDAGMHQYFVSEIIKNKKEEMLPVMIAAKKQLIPLLKQEDPEEALKVLVMDYYNGTKNAEKLVPAAIDYVNNGLMKMDIQGKITADRNDFLPYLTGKEDSSKVKDWPAMKRIMAHGRMVDVSYKFRSAAQAIYANVEDRKVLKQALDWIKLAEGYFPHFSNEAVYAGLLFKYGKKKEAIEMMKKASEDGFIKGADKQKQLLSNVELMKSDKLPEALW